MKKLLTKIKLRYKGYADFQNHINDPEHSKLIITVYPPSFLRRIIVPLIIFWLRHWQWIIATIIAFGVLLVMVLNFIYDKKQP